MGYHLKTPISNGLERTPPIQPVGPKTHTPVSTLKDRGRRFYNLKTGRWINRDPIGERGDLNLYCYTANRPIDQIDYLGMQWRFAWSIGNGKRRKVECDACDTVRSLSTLIPSLDIIDYKHWLKKTPGGPDVPADIDTPVSKKATFTIPNTIYSVIGRLDFSPRDLVAFIMNDIPAANAQAAGFRSLGYFVYVDSDPDASDMFRYFSDEDIYAMIYRGHGPGMQVDESIIGGIPYAEVKPEAVLPGLKHGLGFLLHYGCYSFAYAWESLVYHNGIFMGTPNTVYAGSSWGTAAFQTRVGTYPSHP